MTTKNPKKHGKIIFLTNLQLKCLTIMISFALTGTISIQEYGILVFTYIYLHILSNFAFPNTSPINPSVFASIFPRTKTNDAYVLLTAIIGLFLPITYIFHGVLEGNKSGIEAAVPHVFLLASQVFMEGVAFSGGFSLPVFVFVPVFYNSYRLFSIKVWMENEFLKVEDGSLMVGKALALANVGIWTYNLFGFLIPDFLPKVMKEYYSVSDNSTSNN
ncbi:unnamed protein product [Amaranthus hypochondriacus]